MVSNVNQPEQPTTSCLVVNRFEDDTSSSEADQESVEDEYGPTEDRHV